MTTKLIDDVQVIDPRPVPIYSFDRGISRGISELSPQKTVLQGEVHVDLEQQWKTRDRISSVRPHSSSSSEGAA